ncbi:hypothetical protein TSUD_298800 [Trifolium subterraneum]|nr:hypothetical protein TSUD_298800 [Trifolium subterraneum]
MEQHEEDRLSSLPKIILHRILSRLPEEDAARTSVLSKTWLDTWYTFPILYFYAKKFMEMYPEEPLEESEMMRRTLGFCNYVKRSILRFYDQNLAIKEFNLKVNSCNLRRISKDVDIWLKLACECGVEVIDYDQMVSVGEVVYLIEGIVTAVGSGDGTKEKLKSLSISGLQKLKSVEAIGIPDVSFNAPSLETLYKWFLEQFPKFPFLETLKLRYCKMSERIYISSVRLKVLELSHCSNLKEVTIDAPNLLSLSCGHDGTSASEPTISFLRNSCQLEVNVLIDVHYRYLCNLREFVQNIKPNNVLTSLSLFIYFPSNVAALDPVTLQVSSPPPNIKHLNVDYGNIPENKYLFSSVVNILLSSCCPTTISLRFYSSPGSKEFIQLFYETLMRRKEDECFCTSDNTKCWWHGLKDVKVTSSMKMDENVDFKTNLESCSMSILVNGSATSDFGAQRGGYTVKSGYAMIHRAAQDISVNSKFSSAIRRVWSRKVSLKVGDFVWKLFHDRLTTRTALGRRGLVDRRREKMLHFLL